MEKFTEPIVSIIVEMDEDSGLILLQNRSKPEIPGFRGMLELPQGHMREGESILDCAKRELHEETGLYNFKPRNQVERSRSGTETLESLVTIAVSETGRKSFLAVCVVGTATGEPTDSGESKGPRWYAKEKVYRLINERKVFPLNIPMLKHYYRHMVHQTK